VGARTAIQPAGLIQSQSWQVATNADGFRRMTVLAFSNTASGVNGDGALLRITGAWRPVLVSAIASDSLGRVISVNVLEP